MGWVHSISIYGRTTQDYLSGVLCRGANSRLRPGAVSECRRDLFPLGMAPDTTIKMLMASQHLFIAKSAKRSYDEITTNLMEGYHGCSWMGFTRRRDHFYGWPRRRSLPALPSSPHGRRPLSVIHRASSAVFC